VREAARLREAGYLVVPVVQRRASAANAIEWDLRRPVHSLIVAAKPDVVVDALAGPGGPDAMGISAAEVADGMARLAAALPGVPVVLAESAAN